MTVSEAGAVAGLVFVAAILQAALFSSLDVLSGTADVLLLVLIGIALQRGAVVVVTILVAYAGFGLHFLLGDDVSARRALLETLVPGLALNLIVAAPVFALCRAVLGRVGRADRVTQVGFSG